MPIICNLMRRGMIVLLLLAVAACSPGRTIEAASLLRDVARQEARADIARRDVSYGAEERRALVFDRGDARAALVLVPGATEAALEDPRLIAFAEALARRGFLVMVPALAGDDPLALSAADAGAVAEAVVHLHRAEDAGAVGLAAPSYAAGPTILAALEPEVAPLVPFVITIGAYYDIAESITFLTTGAFREAPDAPWQRAQADEAAPWIFLAANAGRVSDPEDRRRLAQIARARLAGQDAAPLAAGLGAEGRRVLALFVNDDPDRVPALIAELPEALRREIMALDLAQADLSALRARLIAVHGRNDRLVPWTQSARLVEAVGRERARLYLLDELDHVDLAAPGPDDALVLLRVAYRLLAERDAAPAPARPPERAHHENVIQP